MIESTALIYLEQEGFKLIITPVTDATGYRIFGSINPYGIYTEITTLGSFEASSPSYNIWHLPFNAIAENKYFFKVAAIRQ
jgi:hypothetical protein